MENDKYYTPEIEEFHVGFEYQREEYNDISRWDEWYTTTIDTPWQLADYVMYLSNHGFSQTRVKKLDSEDIESLGWRPETIIDIFRGDGNDFSQGFSKKINEIDTYCLIYTDGLLQIYLQHVYNLTSGNWSQQVKFEGTIKNKSELRRLMKQLGINI